MATHYNAQFCLYIEKIWLPYILQTLVKKKKIIIYLHTLSLFTISNGRDQNFVYWVSSQNLLTLWNECENITGGTPRHKT